MTLHYFLASRMSCCIEQPSSSSSESFKVKATNHESALFTIKVLLKWGNSNEVIIFHKKPALFLSHCVCGLPRSLHWLSWQIQNICSDVPPLRLCSCHTRDSGRHPSGAIGSISPWHLQRRGSVEPSPVASLPAALKVRLIHVFCGYKKKSWQG